MKAIISINGTIPAVQPLSDGYSVLTSDLVSSASGRSAETGKVMRYLVRSNTYKLLLKFKGKTADVAQVYSLMKAFTLTVCFYDPTITGGYITADFYSGDQTFTPKGETAELSVNLIEI